jgi:hypothetical protein
MKGPMLVVVAGPGDAVAQALVERWAGRGAVRLAPADLSAPGWRHYLGRRPCDAEPGRAVLDQRVVATDRIAGVVTRLPAVYDQDLDWVDPLDRAYVAAEMTAFLTAWLTALPCPVLNRPTPTCLAGPSLAPEQWVRLAAGLGIPVRPVHRRALLTLHPDDVRPGDDAVVEPPAAPLPTLTVVGQRCLGGDDPVLADSALRLAQSVGAELLAVQFDGFGPAARFCAASPWPDVSAPDVASALLERIEAR